MVGRPGAGLQPIRGHSNIQGMGTVGVTPTLKDADVQPPPEPLTASSLPTTKGYEHARMPSMPPTADAMRFALLPRRQPLRCKPGCHRMPSGRWSRIDTVVYLNTSLNTGPCRRPRAEETIILPVLARDEEPEPSTQESMFSYVRLSDGGMPRHVGPRAEVEIISDLAQRVLGGRRAAAMR